MSKTRFTVVLIFSFVFETPSIIQISSPMVTASPGGGQKRTGRGWQWDGSGMVVDCERSGRRVGSSRSSGTIANSVATTRELSQRSEQLRVLLVHRTNIPAQFLSSAAELAIAHGTPALPLLSQSAPKPPPLMAGARLPCRRRHPRLVARPAPSAPARWPRAASAETAAQLLGGRSGSRLPRHRHPTARCPNGPPTANRPLTDVSRVKHSFGDGPLVPPSDLEFFV